MRPTLAILPVAFAALTSSPAMGSQPRGVIKARDCDGVAADVVLSSKLKAKDAIERQGLPISKRYRLLRAQDEYWERQRRPAIAAECRAYLTANPGAVWQPPEE